MQYGHQRQSKMLAEMVTWFAAFRVRREAYQELVSALFVTIYRHFDSKTLLATVPLSGYGRNIEFSIFFFPCCH